VAIYRVREWDGFRGYLVKFRPGKIFYAVEESPLSRPPIALRLLFVHGGDTYIFVDFARGNSLAKTGIPVLNPRGSTPWISVDALKSLILRDLDDVELVDFSMTTIL